MNYKQLPNGISDFAQLRKGNFYYVDKTMYINEMEDCPNFLFINRPKRFGKSVFTSMVREYYDTVASEHYEELFKDTAIYRYNQEHKDEEGFRDRHGNYQVLYFDFSQVTGDSIEEIKRNFNDYCCEVLDQFIDTHASVYSEYVVNHLHETTDASSKLNIVGIYDRSCEHHLYIIVDEHDSFLNKIVTSCGLKTSDEVMRNTRFYCNFLKIFKPIASRYLIMTTTPCKLNDLTSGLNNFTIVSDWPSFNMAFGFSEDEVRQMISYYQKAGLITGDADEIVDEMQSWYGNYYFSDMSYQVDPKMLNSYHVLYYLQSLIDTGKAPSEMVDPKTATDYDTIRGLLKLDNEKKAHWKEVKNLLKDKSMHLQTEKTFEVEHMIRPIVFPSMLYYYGLLTKDSGRHSSNPFMLSIPNKATMQQFEQLMKEAAAATSTNAAEEVK